MTPAPRAEGQKLFLVYHCTNDVGPNDEYYRKFKILRAILLTHEGAEEWGKHNADYRGCYHVVEAKEGDDFEIEIE